MGKKTRSVSKKYDRARQRFVQEIEKMNCRCFAAADLTIEDNHLVSSKHCVLMKGAEERGVVIKDTSTNGTLLNGKKMVKGEEVNN